MFYLESKKRPRLFIERTYERLRSLEFSFEFTILTDFQIHFRKRGYIDITYKREDSFGRIKNDDLETINAFLDFMQAMAEENYCQNLTGEINNAKFQIMPLEKIQDLYNELYLKILDPTTKKYVSKIEELRKNGRIESINGNK